MEYILSDIIELIGGGTPKTSVPEYWDGDIPWLSVKDFSGEKRYVYETEKYITEDGLNNSSTKYLNQDDIIVSARGTVGEMAMIPFPMTFNQSCYGIRAKRQLVDPFYLYYLLKYNLGVLKSKVHGSVFDTITKDTFKQITVDVPDLEVQKKVADILGNLDDKIENNEKINRNLLEQAVTIFTDMIWSHEKNGVIGDYCTMKSGFAFKSSWWTGAGVKVIKIGDINQDNLNLNTCSCVDEDKVEKAGDFTVSAGDLVLAMTGATIGKFAMVPERDETILVNQRVGKFFLGNEPLKKVPFIYCTLKMDEVYSEVIGRGQGSAQPNISANDIMTIPCVIPEQKVIDDFNNIAEPIFTSIVKNQNENEQLASLRDILLPKLMSGELSVEELEV